MNKFGVVLGVAAVATLAGCKDPDYKYGSAPASQNEVKNADVVAVEPAAAPKCTCAPGTKHTEPCKCGAPDCKCVVETKPVIVVPEPQKNAAPVEPDYTIYVVQNGDYLAKISKKYNVTIASIRRLNPSIKKDVIRVGQKIKLPGKLDVPAVTAAPAAKSAPAAGKKTAKKSYVPYTGATKEYVVKSGDTLGSVAYGNGLNIRQFKELNGLSSDSLKVGQKLKIPAEKVVKAAPAAEAKAEAASPAAKPVEAPKAEAKAEAAAPVEAPKAEAEAKTEAVAAAPVAAAEAAKPAAPATTTYVVQEGDDMTGVSIRWGVSAAEIRELNNLSETDQLVPGQIIKLPAEAQQ